MAGILSLQYRQVFGDKSANLRKIKQMIKENSDKKLDLVVLPEFFSTGICDEAFVQAPENPDGGDTIKFVSDLAVKYNTNIISGSVIEKDGDKLYNTMFVIDRNGKTVAKYRKIHLFGYMGGNEDKTITPGNEEVVIDLDFARVGLSICFDIRYPLHHRKLAQKGAEIIVSPSAFSCLTSLSDEEKNDFINMWRSFNTVRAAENIIYFVSSNLFGLSYSYLYSIGNSMISDYNGKVLADAKEDETAIYYDINLSAAERMRRNYPACNID